MRKKLSFDIWNNIKNSPEHYGVHMQFIELYVNNSHRGIYCINENINDEFLNLSGSEAHYYKSYSWEGTKFSSPIPAETNTVFWNGWEQIYPDHKQNINWKPLTDLYAVAVKEDYEYFKQKIGNLINIDNFIDYYIFIQLVAASDNYGKNQLLLKRNTSTPFNLIPWDLDATWGRDWLNNPISPNSIFANSLFKRLIEVNPNNYNQRIKKRWNSLRSTHYNKESLIQLLDNNHDLLQKSNIIDIENMVWKTQHDVGNEKEFMKNWLSTRLFFLDTYFNSL